MSKEIRKSEIRKGDFIRVAFPPDDGVSETRRGIAHTSTYDNDWTTEEGGELTYHQRLFLSKITLLSRPSPPVPTEPGTIFRVTELRGEACDVVMFVRVNGSFEDQRIYVSSHRVHCANQHPSADITAWEPIEGVTA